MFDIILLFFFSFTSLFHPIHLSITNISYIEDKNQFDLSIRLYRDDLECIINHKYDKNIILTDDKILDEEIGLVNKYINDMFLFVANKDTLLLDSADIIFEELLLVAYFKLDVGENLKTLEIKNTLIMDLYPDQKNLLIINYKQKEKGYQFTINDYRQKIVL